MREIKFRAWSEIERRMYLHGELVNFPYNLSLKDIKDSAEWSFMQFTGLEDKNARDVYEGDIVSTWHKGLPENKFRYLVVFEKGRFVRRIPGLTVVEEIDIDNEYFVWEVIGNIYETPELLPKQ